MCVTFYHCVCQTAELRDKWLWPARNSCFKKSKQLEKDNGLPRADPCFQTLETTQVYCKSGAEERDKK